MKKKINLFIIRLAIFSVIIALAGYILDYFLPEGSLTPLFPHLIILFFIITAGIHIVLLRISRMSPGKFVNYFMLVTFIKLLIYFVAVLIYVFTTTEGILQFIVAFFLLYLLFTVFEVATILTQTKENKMG